MKSLRTLLTLLLVAVWPLATSHCNLEQLPGFEFLSCAIDADAAHAESDCETDSCASIESGVYKTEDNQQTVPTPPSFTSEFLTTMLLAQTELVSTSINDFAPAPPELPKSWQFSFRTALSPRAPSLVS
ncbi:MAG TPA: hypothetical protein VFZ59_08505 [Verrucomicrobiae bacterium]|nr:hypothetical protein [Verrucomicrobiae bacterium]